MSHKRREKKAGPECLASGIRGEYEAHGAEEFYVSQGSVYSNPHEDQLKVGVPRCFDVWKDKLPVPFVRLLMPSRHHAPWSLRHTSSHVGSARYWTSRVGAERSHVSSIRCFLPFKHTALILSHTKRNSPNASPFDPNPTPFCSFSLPHSSIAAIALEQGNRAND